MIISSFHPNVDFVFLYQLFSLFIMYTIYISLYCFWCINMNKSFLVFPYSIEPRILTKSGWNYNFFYCGNVKFVMKYTNNFLTKNKTFLHHKISSLLLILYFITQLTRVPIVKRSSSMYRTFIYIWNIWDLILWKETGNKQSSCSDDS